VRALVAAEGLEDDVLARVCAFSSGLVDPREQLGIDCE